MIHLYSGPHRLGLQEPSLQAPRCRGPCRGKSLLDWAHQRAAGRCLGAAWNQVQIFGHVGIRTQPDWGGSGRREHGSRRQAWDGTTTPTNLSCATWLVRGEGAKMEGPSPRAGAGNGRQDLYRRCLVCAPALFSVLEPLLAPRRATSGLQGLSGVTGSFACRGCQAHFMDHLCF